MKRILVPLREDDEQTGVVEFARALVTGRPAEVLLLRIDDWPALGPLGWKGAAEVSVDSLVRLKEEFNALDGTTSRIVSSTAVDSYAVLDQARLHSASLILVPYRHERTFTTLLRGHPVDRLFRESGVPVLVVPSTAPLASAGIRRITYLFREDEAAVSALQQVIEFAQRFEAAVDLMRIGAAREQQEPLEERLAGILKKREVPVRILPATGASPDEIAAALSGTPADLVVLSESRIGHRTETAPRLLPSISVPLLVLPESSPVAPEVGTGTPARVGI